VSEVLALDGARVRYGGIEAVKGISLSVSQGEIVTLIGSNGAGKTSTLKAIVGLVPLAAGSVRLFGADVRGVATHELARRGVQLVPEGRAIFGNLTVRENLLLGAWTNRSPERVEQNLARVVKLFPRLGERFAQEGGTLSGGEQQMLAIARALMASTSPASASRPRSSARCSRRSARWRPAGSRCCSWSRTRVWRSRRPAAPTCWSPVRSCWRAPPENWRATSA
jgi:ABC-type branched-subunit amino acid transport system ATPase component